MRCLVWFRGKDLRLADHDALLQACDDSRELVLVFVLAPKYFGGGVSHGPAHRLQYLLQALRELSDAVRVRGNRLLVVPGPAAQALPMLVGRLRLQRVHALRSVEPDARAQEAAVAAALQVPLHLHDGETLAPAGSVLTRNGAAFSVFTPFARAFRAQVRVRDAVPAPQRLPPPPAALALHAAHALHIPELAELGLRDNPRAQVGGERAALERLGSFLSAHAAHYTQLRDRMDLPGTSRLSADLHFGALSVRAVWNAAGAGLPPGSASAERFCSQLLWREFAHHTLHARPGVLREPFRADFIGFPWRSDRTSWDAWTAGMTGYPVVDAAARQLLAEGFVHNRARMIAASFLTKQLMLEYARGEEHYLHWLCDGDLAQNNLGWQWAAGAGCDAQPYFRMFNPEAQGKRFDPDGNYVRRYLPELQALPAEHIHAPWRAPGAVLQRAGVVLGRSYPKPIVDHATARRRYLLVAGEAAGERRKSVPLPKSAT